MILGEVPDLVLSEEGLNHGGIAVLGDRNHDEVFSAQGGFQAVKGRHLGYAWPAPGRPEVQKHDPATEVGERSRFAICGEAGLRCWRGSVVRGKLRKGSDQRRRRVGARLGRGPEQRNGAGPRQGENSGGDADQNPSMDATHGSNLKIITYAEGEP
jgi:hypothetical protein